MKSETSHAFGDHRRLREWTEWIPRNRCDACVYLLRQLNWVVKSENCKQKRQICRRPNFNVCRRLRCTQLLCMHLCSDQKWSVFHFGFLWRNNSNNCVHHFTCDLSAANKYDDDDDSHSSMRGLHSFQSVDPQAMTHTLYLAEQLFQFFFY